MADRVIREHSAGAVIFYMDRDGNRLYLLLHYPSGHWDFPKGMIEEGEDPLETAYREIYEETGIPRDKLELIDGFVRDIHYKFMSHGSLIYKTVTFYLMRSYTLEVTLSYEHKGFKWLPVWDAIRQATYKTAKELIEDAERYIRRLIMDGRLKP